MANSNWNKRLDENIFMSIDATFSSSSFSYYHNLIVNCILKLKDDDGIITEMRVAIVRGHNNKIVHAFPLSRDSEGLNSPSFLVYCVFLNPQK